MRNKSAGKNSTDPVGSLKLSVTRKSKAMTKSPTSQIKRKARQSAMSSVAGDGLKKKKDSIPAKSPVRTPEPDQSLENTSKTSVKVRSSKKESDKTVERSKKTKNVLKKNEKNCGKSLPKVSTQKAKLNGKKKVEMKSKGRPRKKDTFKNDNSQFIDIWSLASIGKREASLNATMKVNIMYEKNSPKKALSSDSPSANLSPSPTKTSNDTKRSEKEKVGTPVKGKYSPSAKKIKSLETKEGSKKTKATISPKKSGTSDKKNTSRKRKSQYKIYEDEPASKARKKDTKKPVKAKAKKIVRKRKKTVLGHSLGNIIERSPRQASLNAKAMIAMEQEEDIIVETAARTKVYYWTEVRTCVANDSRKIVWVTGSGDLKSVARSQKTRKRSTSNDTKVSIQDVLENANIDKTNVGSLHDTLLKAIHETGDARLLKEFMRSHKEDFPGDIDIERCPTPPPPPPPPEPAKEPSTPSPKKKSTTSSKPSETKKTPEKQIKKPIVPSPTKLCRVATPIPQFSPNQQRPSQISGFVHHPSSQPLYSNFGDQQQHQKQQPTPTPPQPIKVTPYAPSSAYVYQCSPTNRQQQGIFVPNTPSPMPPPFGNDANNLVQRNFPAASFTFNQMGSLSFERRGLNPYQHPSSGAYPQSMHLPIQPIGFNFQQFYQPSLQQLHSQQPIQQVPLPAHQQYALVPPHPLPPPSVMQQSQPLPPAHMNSIRPFQPSTYTQPYPNPSSSASNVVKQDKSCMPPPPPCPVAQSLPQQSPMTSIVQPLPSYRRAIPISPQVQSPQNLIKPTPERLLSISVGNTSCSNTATLSTPVVTHAFHNPLSQTQHIFKPIGSNNSVIIQPQPIRPVATVNASFRPIACKKETKATQQNCDKVNSPNNNVESPRKIVAVRNGVDDSSPMSDILHSAHSTMFSVEEKSTSDSPGFMKQRNQSVISTSAPTPAKESKLVTMLASSRGNENFNGAYSVTSILEMPSCKIKTEPKAKSCAIAELDQKNKIARKETYYLCLPPPKVSGKPGTSLLTTTAIPLKEPFPFKLSDNTSIKEFPHSDKVIVIDDEDSSDDEPLAKLVQPKADEVTIAKPSSNAEKAKIVGKEGQKNTKVKNNPKALKIKLFEKKSDLKASKLKETNPKTNSKPCKDGKSTGKGVTVKSKELNDKSLSSPVIKIQQTKGKNTTTTQLKPKQLNHKTVKTKKVSDSSSVDKTPSVVTTKSLDKADTSGCENDENKAGGSNSGNAPTIKKPGSKAVKKAPVRRKSKTHALIPPVLPKTKAVHGWSWIGKGEWKMIPKLTQLKEESLRLRKCYTSMKHSFGEVISVKDCVILQSDGDGCVPYVGKVSALWENLNGDMMFSMLWYYQPEHTAAGREPEDGEQELFASKHREENSVACIDDKCYVLMYNEFCRMEADVMRHDLGVPTPSSHQVIPKLSDEDRKFLRPLPPPDVGLDNIWFCRYDYDTRKKIVRKPKHKKTDLRYRGPCKLVQVQ